MTRYFEEVKWRLVNFKARPGDLWEYYRLSMLEGYKQAVPEGTGESGGVRGDTHLSSIVEAPRGSFPDLRPLACCQQEE